MKFRKLLTSGVLAATLTTLAVAGASAPAQADSVTNQIDRFAGKGKSFAWDSADGNLATEAPISMPTATAVGPDGAAYLATDRRIRRVDPVTHTISTVAGNGTGWEPVDGVPATSTPLSNAASIFVDAAGNVYFSDYTEARKGWIRRIDKATGIVSNYIGGGTSPADGATRFTARFDSITDFVIDSRGRAIILARDSSGSPRMYSMHPGIGIVREVPTGSYTLSSLSIDSRGRIYASVWDGPTLQPRSYNSDTGAWSAIATGIDIPARADQHLAVDSATNTLFVSVANQRLGTSKIYSYDLTSGRKAVVMDSPSLSTEDRVPGPALVASATVRDLAVAPNGSLLIASRSSAYINEIHCGEEPTALHVSECAY